jgi:hypothetical protein
VRPVDLLEPWPVRKATWPSRSRRASQGTPGPNLSAVRRATPPRPFDLRLPSAFQAYAAPAVGPAGHHRRTPGYGKLYVRVQEVDADGVTINGCEVTLGTEGSLSGSRSLEAHDVAAEQVQAALGRVADGDATAVATLHSRSYVDLIAAYAAAGPRVLRPSGVVRVLESLRSG